VARLGIGKEEPRINADEHGSDSCVSGFWFKFSVSGFRFLVSGEFQISNPKCLFRFFRFLIDCGGGGARVCREIYEGTVFEIGEEVVPVAAAQEIAGPAVVAGANRPAF